MHQLRWLRVCLSCAIALGASPVLAEPYLAVAQGYACSACHVNPTGGGLRNEFGAVFAQNVMPATRLPTDAPVWTGKLSDWLRIGGDFRTSWTATEGDEAPRQQQSAVDQLRVYLQVEPIPGRLSLNIDESLAPGAATAQEAYVRYADPGQGWYAKAGKFYLPFGWRVQDNSAFVREVSGVSMLTPDTGAEFGVERRDWSAQFALTNGAANAGEGEGFAATGQFVYLRSRWRIGVAGGYTDASDGDRRMAGVFAGVRTGPIVWLGEVDLVRDDSFADGSRTFGAALGEANWQFAAGHNLKLTAEYFEPDRDVDDDAKTRYSALYELTPAPFLQLRAGFREYEGIPQAPRDNRRLAFIEVHGFF